MSPRKGSANGPKPKLLVVDDNPEIRTQLKWGLNKTYEILEAENRAEAVRVFRAERPAVVTLDLGMPPDPDGVSEEWARSTRFSPPTRPRRSSWSPGTPRGTTRAARSTGRMGLLHEAGRSRRSPRHPGQGVPDRGARGREPPPGSGRGGRMGDSGDLAGDPARPDDDPEGGPERRHGPRDRRAALGRSWSPARSTPSRRGGRGDFAAINCGAIPETLLEAELFGHEKGAFTGAHVQRLGKVEHASGGTLFLDEITEMSPALQVKLLRFLQEGVVERIGGRETIPVDVRVIAATNRDIKEAISTGLFREDLYYRLAVVEIPVPPLRSRGDDLSLLARVFFDRAWRRNGRRVGDLRPRPMRRCSRIPGPGTCGNSRTASAARSSWPTARSSRRPTWISRPWTPPTSSFRPAGLSGRPARPSSGRWSRPPSSATAETSRARRRTSRSPVRPSTT